MPPIDPQGRPNLAPKVRLQFDSVRGEPVLLYPEGLLVLNATAHEIVRRCSGQVTVDDLVRLLVQEYDAPEEMLRQDMLETLTDLHRRKLIVFSP
jgi:coenzyme PQQ biosynthesis protein PqqD